MFWIPLIHQVCRSLGGGPHQTVVFVLDGHCVVVDGELWSDESCEYWTVVRKEPGAGSERK
jgi:hypothetical protein